jgi:hypothetical protein
MVFSQFSNILTFYVGDIHLTSCYLKLITACYFSYYQYVNVAAASDIKLYSSMFPSLLSVASCPHSLASTFPSTTWTVN